MNDYIPTQDQMVAQLRLIIPPLGTVISALGVSGVTTHQYVDLAMACVGPIAYVIVSGWSFWANSRKSILLSAAKPLDANTPAPKIILAPQEKALADSLPTNVVAAKTVAEVAPVAKVM